MGSLKVVKKGNEITIQIIGDFTYDIHHEFRNAYRYEAENSRFIIDMSRTENMDSSALGMLLLLREFAGGDKSDISIVNESPQLRSILEIVRFEKLFRIN